MRVRSSAILAAALLAACGGEGRYPEQCAARLSGWKQPSDGYSALATTNKVLLLRDGTLRWNGKTINADQLAKYSSVLPTMNPVPFTILEVENGASCAVVENTRETINDRAKCIDGRWSSCGEGTGPWATVGDVIGPNGEMYKELPDGRIEIIKPSAEQRAAQIEALNRADEALDAASNQHPPHP